MMKKWQGNTDDEKVANKIRMMKKWQKNMDDEKLATKYG